MAGGGEEKEQAGDGHGRSQTVKSLLARCLEQGKSINSNTNSSFCANVYYQQFTVLCETSEGSKVFAASSHDFFTCPNAIAKLRQSFNSLIN